MGLSLLDDCLRLKDAYWRRALSDDRIPGAAGFLLAGGPHEDTGVAPLFPLGDLEVT